MKRYICKNKSERRLTYSVNTAAIALSFVLLLFFFGKTRSSVALVWTCCVFALMAASLNITMGLMGQLSLGQSGFMAIGAYTATLFANLIYQTGFFANAGDSNYIFVLLLGSVIGGISAAIIGFVLAAPALRLSGDYLAIITLGFGLIVRSVLDNIAGPTLYNPDCRMYIADRFKSYYLFYILLLTTLCLLAIYTFSHSKYGKALRSLRDDPIAASACGVNISSYKILGFAVSSFFAGVAGVFYAAMMPSLSTGSFAFASSSIYNSTFIVVMVVLGGMGSFTGSVVTAAAMVILNHLIRTVSDASPFYFIAKYPMLLYAMILLAVILLKPHGIFGTSEFSLMRLLRLTGEKKTARKEGA